MARKDYDIRNIMAFDHKCMYFPTMSMFPPDHFRRLTRFTWYYFDLWNYRTSLSKNLFLFGITILLFLNLFVCQIL